MIPQVLCTKCHNDFMHCHCDQFHPNIGVNIGMTLDELRLIQDKLSSVPGCFTEEQKKDCKSCKDLEEAKRIVEREIKGKTMDPRKP